MLNDGNFNKVIICCGKVDLRRGIDGLSAYVRLNYGLEPLEKGTLFLFCGTRSDRIKGLLWEGDGYLLMYKRLSKGSKFQWPRNPAEARMINSEQFRRLMDGFSIDSSIQKVYPKLLDE